MKVATITYKFQIDETFVNPNNLEDVIEITITEGETEEDSNTGYEYSERTHWKDDQYAYVSISEEMIHAVSLYRDLACLNDNHKHNSYRPKNYKVIACDYIKWLHNKLPETLDGVCVGGSSGERLKRYHSQYLTGMSATFMAYNDDHACLKSEKIYGIPPSILYDENMELCSGFYEPVEEDTDEFYL